MVELQGGDLSALPEPTGETPVCATRAGWIQTIDGLEVGLCGVALGAGRTRSDQDVDPVVGIRLDRHRGERVEEGEPFATILHGRQGAPSPEVVERLGAAFTLGDEEPEPTPLVLERIG